MPNLWKYIAHPKAEPYQFTEAAELLTDEPQMPSSETAEDAEPLPEEEAALSEEPSESTDTLRYAEVQADRLLRDAKRQAEAIREQAEREAEERNARDLAAIIAHYSASVRGDEAEAPPLYCAKCGARLKDGASFCAKCGAPAGR